MRFPNWRDWISMLRGKSATKKPLRSPRRRLHATTFSIRQLEERRVFDGALPVAIVDAVGVLAVSTGTADGSADLITVARAQDASHDTMEVTVNGQEVYRGETSSIQEIHVSGSTDDDTLIVDLGEGSPIPAGGIHFAPGSYNGHDALELRGGAAEQVAYSATGVDAGTVSITIGGSTGTIEYSGKLQSVTDTLAAGVREFELGHADAQLSAGIENDGLSQFELAGGPTFQFANPSDALFITAETSDGIARSVDVSGLEGGFDADLAIRLGQGDSVHFSGVTSLTKGSLSVSAGSIDVSGTISADGGSLQFDAGPQGTLLVSGELDASGRTAGQHGGTIELLGSRVAVYGNAVIDASGDAGGGIVHIGGDFQGANPLVRNADQVMICANVQIHADAVSYGDGGQVVVWSNDITRFHGLISARGGLFAGDGGLAEVSGLRELAFTGRVDLSAPSGTMGSLWLDPLVIRIKNQNTGVDDIQLDINVPTVGDPAGVIFFNDLPATTLTISETALESSTAHLILQARNEIVLENLSADGVLLLAPNVNITLQTRNDALLGDSATGGISFDNVANTIQTQGSGTITIQAGVTADAAGTVATRQGTADLVLGNLKTGGGAVVLEASRNIFASNATDSAGGTISIHSDAREIGSGFYFLQPGGSVNTGGGALTIVGADVALLGTVNSGAAETTLVTTAGRTVRLGLGTADFTLDPLELQNITAGNLTVGDSINGDITINGVTATDLSNISGMVTLLATGDNRSVAFGGFPSSFRTLTVRADNGIYVIFGSPVTTVGDLILDGDADNAPDGDDAIHFAVGVTLESAAKIDLKATTGGLIGDRALTLLARQGVALQSSLTVPGPGFIAINADSDGDGIGKLNLANGISIDSTDDPLTIITADLDLNATSTLTSGAGPMLLQTTNGRTMGVGAAAGDWQLSGDELSRISANGLTIGGTANGDISVDGVTISQSDSVGSFTLQALAAGAKVKFEGADSAFLTLSTTADAGIEFSAGLPLTATIGSLQFQVANGNLVGAGALTLNAANGIALNNSLVTSGALHINADFDGNGTGQLTVATGMSVTTNDNPISILSAELNLSGFSNSGTANTTLVATAGRSVRLGLGTADYTIDNSELQHITAAHLTIGDSTNGDVSVVGVNAADVANIPGMVTLLATANGRTIAFGGLPSTFRSLTARADNGISIGFGFPATTVGDLILDADFDNSPDSDDAIRFAVGVTLESAGAMNLKAASGGLIGNLALTLRAAQGIVLQNSLIVPGLGFLTINADTDANGIGALNLADGISVDSTGDPLTITAADIDLNATSTLTSGAGPTILQTTNGRTMGVGTAAGDWQLSGDELSRITSNGLTIGGTANGNVFIENIAAADSDSAGAVAVQAIGAGKQVQFLGAASTFTALSTVADAGIGFSAGLTLTAANGGLQFQTATGLLSGAGSLTLNATDAVSINSSLTTAGALAINADADANGTGTFTISSGNGVNTSDNSLSILSADINLLGTLNSGAADTTLAGTTLTRIMGIGNSAGDWQLSGGELTRITALNLNLGGTTNGHVVVDGVTAAQTASVAGTVRLFALGAGRNITFATSPSSFRSLSAAADNGIFVNMDLTTTVGNLLLDGDADDAADGDDAIHFAPVTVTSAGLLQLQASTGGMIGMGSLNLLAQNGVQLDSSLALAGPLTIDSDTDDNGSGTFTLAAGQSVTTAVSPLSITSADIDLQGTLNSGAGETALFVSAPGRTMGIGNGAGAWSLSGAELERITAAGLSIGGTTNGNLTVDGVTAAQSANIAGSVTLRATGSGRSIAFSGGASTFRSLTAEADNGISVSTNITTTIGDLVLDGDFDDALDGNDAIQFAGGTLTSANQMILRATIGGLQATGNLVLQANNGVRLEGSLVMTGSGSILINDDADANGTGTFEVNDGFTVNSGNNPLTIVSADIDLHASGTLNSGAATTVLRTTNGRTIGVGTGAGQWQLSGSELQRITAGSLVIGDATNGDVTVGGVTAAQSANIAGTVSVNATASGKRIAFEGADSTFHALAANSNGGMTFTAGLTLTASTGDMTLQSPGPLVAAGALTLNAAGSVNLHGTLTTAGNLTINADTDANATGIFLLAAGGAINTADHAIEIHSADISLMGTLNSGAADTTLVATAGRPVRLGLATADYTLDSGELQRISAANLTVGDTTNGNISVNGVAPLDLAGVPGMITLLATGNGRSISFGGNSSFFPSLTARADNGIFVAFGPPTTTSGDFILDGDADNAFDGDDAVRFAAGMALESAGAMRLKATTGGLIGERALTLHAARGVTVESSLTVTGPGFIEINADRNADGLGDMVVLDGASISSTDDPLAITAADIHLNGTSTLNSGAAVTRLLTTNGRTMGVGSAAGDWQLSGSEFQRVTSSGLTIGSTANGDLSVDGVTAAHSAGAGFVTLQATGAGRRIHFQGSDSTFSGLSAQAHSGIDFTAGLTLTATTGGLSFETGGGLTGAGSLTLNAANSVRFNGSLTTSGALAVNADTNSDGAGLFALSNGQNVSTTNHALSIVSADIDLQGDLSSGAADITLVATANRTVRVGQGTAEYSIDSSELQNLTAANLTIGDSTNGNISVNGVAGPDLANIAGTVNLLATGNGRSISFIGNSSSFPALTARADNGIVVGFGPPRTTVGDLFLDGDADNAADTDDAVRFASEIILESAGALRLKATSGGLFGDRALTLLATRGVTLDDSLSVPGPGFISIQADTNADGIGDFLLASGRTVNSFNNPLSVISADIDLLGFLNSGTAAMLLKPSQVSASIGLENGAAGFSLDNAELNRIVGTTGVITIGETGNVGGMTIGLNGPLLLGSRNFDLVTGAAIQVGTNDFTTTGNVAVRADADGNGSGNISNLGGRISAGTLTMRAAQGIDLLVGAGTMDALNSLTGDIDLDANGAIQVNRAVQSALGNIVLTAAGSITVVANQPGVSALAGMVELDANGAAADIAVNSLVETTDATLMLLADRNVTFGSGGSASTSAGTITIHADEAAGSGFGALTMSEGSFVESVTGTIVAIADGDITLGRIETGNATANAIQLTSALGGIVDSGDTASTRNLVANAAGAITTISARTGVGSAGALEVTIAELNLTNAASGQVDLSEADAIVIDRLEQGGAGFVRLTAGGAITLAAGQPGVTSSAGGDVNLTSNDTLSIHAPITATGGSGSILLTAAGAMTFGDTGAAVDFLTEGAGLITAVSGGALTVDPGVVLESGTGVVTSRFPALDVVVTNVPRVLGADVTLDVTFGDTGGRNYTVTVDWSDGVSESIQSQNPGTVVFFHQYQTNPNSNDPSALVPISVTVASDPNIQLRGSDLPAIVAQTADTLTTASDEPALRTFAQTNITVPGFINLSSSNDAAGQDASFLFFSAGGGSQETTNQATALLVGSEVTVPLDFSQTTQTVTLGSAEVSLVEERQVFLEVLNPYNEVIERVQLREEVLDDLPGFLRKLPDGHYRVLLREPGDKRMRLIIDVEIRQGKPASGTDEGGDKPPKDDVARRQLPGPPLFEMTEPVANSNQTPSAIQPDELEFSIPSDSESRDPPAPDVTLEPGGNPTEQPVAAGAFVAVGLAAVGTDQVLRERFAKMLQEVPADGFGRVARLRRRLRRIMIESVPK